ncbi:hypothetical protein MNV49_007087 [Pseudohyphozyma bogoriensis]|nr:hypothetical protein MNV49_007087 [Pseudohyphozyma bogoriensis]
MSSGTKRIRGVSVYRPIIYGNSACLIGPGEPPVGDHTHRWTVAVRSAVAPAVLTRDPNQHIGGGDDISHFIKKVTFKLHDTYSTPLRSIESPPFEVTETGWGEFDIHIKIFFVPEANEKPINLTHHLKLHPWPLAPPTIPANPSDPPLEIPEPLLSPVHAWQYEEIVFSEPMDPFYTILLGKQPTPLPKSNRHGKTAAYLLGPNGGQVGEFSLDMEDEEGARLEAARQKTLVQIEALREKLAGHDGEIAKLKKELEEAQAAAAAKASSATPA